MIKNRKAERGNALVYVFVGIALFGALMFLFSRGASQNTGAMTTQQANITASEMIQYRQSLESAVQKLLSKGCSEADISFENDSETGYTNASAPSDKSCNVFDGAGGKAKYLYPPAASNTTYAAGTSPGYKNYGFNGNMVIKEIGSIEPELIIWSMTNKETCDAINRSIGQKTEDESFADGLIGVPFVGTFATSGTAGVIGDETYPEGISTGCVNRPVYSGQYIYYSVLLAR